MATGFALRKWEMKSGMRMSGVNVVVTLVTNESQKKPWCFGKTCGSFA